MRNYVPLRKNIALIGYTSHYFLPFAEALEAAGFRVFWVHSLRSFTHYLLAKGVPPSRIRDLSDSRQFEQETDKAIRDLESVEGADLPRINDIILMDRRLRTKKYGFALSYLAHASRTLKALVADEEIWCFSSGRDTSLQLLSMLVARQCGITWAGVAYVRLPIERYMFTRSHHTHDIFQLGEVRTEHLHAAQEYLTSFRRQALRPYVRPSSPSWKTVFARLPLHVREGWRLVGMARHDAGNDFARYRLTDIMKMYLSKKLHLLQYNWFLQTYALPIQHPYLLFGLHRQPESSVDVVGAYFSDQIYLVRTIARSIPIGYDLLVKLHVSDADGWPLSFYRTLEKIPGVRLIGPTVDSRGLVRGAALTITNSGTMAYEAGLLGQPAITFSKVHFNDLPTVRYCDSPVALPGLIDEMLRRTPKPRDDADVEGFLARMFAWSFAGQPNRAVFDAPLTASDLKSLVHAYETLYRHSGRSCETEISHARQS